MVEYWKGNLIEHLGPKEVFVFGSNPAGIHGAGAAKSALLFGAKMGVGRGLQGKSYALVTKNLKEGYLEKETGIIYQKAGFCSVSLEQIRENVKQLYEVAKSHPEVRFLISFMCKKNARGGYEKSLNGYDGLQMVSVFLQDEIPPNIVFHESYKEHVESHLKRRQGVVFFYGYEDILSNFHPSRFEYREHRFACVEHFFMYCKAQQFKDTKIVEQIESVCNQGIVKAFLEGAVSREEVLKDHAREWVSALRVLKQLGRQVAGFKEGVWEKKRSNIMMVGLREKFLQNPALLEGLLATEAATLIECSPSDWVWGVGASRSAAEKIWKEGGTFKGANGLGECLMKVRTHCQSLTPKGLKF